MCESTRQSIPGLKLIPALLLAVSAASLTAPTPAQAQTQVAQTKAAAPAKQPPSCAAISFRPLPEGMTDGDQEAGLYKSRFGRVTVLGSVKGGKTSNYYVTVNNTKPSGALPASVATCASAKKLPAPGTANAACVGDRFQVLIDREGDKRYIAFYALSGGKWNFCSGGVA